MSSSAPSQVGVSGNRSVAPPLSPAEFSSNEDDGFADSPPPADVPRPNDPVTPGNFYSSSPHSTMNTANANNSFSPADSITPLTEISQPNLAGSSIFGQPLRNSNVSWQAQMAEQVVAAAMARLQGQLDKQEILLKEQLRMQDASFRKYLSQMQATFNAQQLREANDRQNLQRHVDTLHQQVETMGAQIVNLNMQIADMNTQISHLPISNNEAYDNLVDYSAYQG
ncbi:hypothetical protein K431DRAFT_307139 [Polychaeton citri CBS 116435]|uniref:Uncharacterized protein n=1 Tax=Polychaeton citri CBS 116435 TaxID=1314669 RepID=A0A9P4PYD6_9PEZI|nr:hypothetical protein K431DRAFT_307139 [Polychaeton citri CBS 116435]